MRAATHLLAHPPASANVRVAGLTQTDVPCLVAEPFAHEVLQSVSWSAKALYLCSSSNARERTSPTIVAVFYSNLRFAFVLVLNQSDFAVVANDDAQT